MFNLQKPTSFFKLGLLFIVALSLVSCNAFPIHTKSDPAPPPAPLPGNGTFLYHDGVLLGELLQGEDEAYTNTNECLWIMSPNGYFIRVTNAVADVYEYVSGGNIFAKTTTISVPEDIAGSGPIYGSSYEIIKPYIDKYPNEARVMNVVTNNGTTYYILINYKNTFMLPSGSAKFHKIEYDYPTASTVYGKATLLTSDVDIYPATPITKETFNKEFRQGWAADHNGYEIGDAEGSFIRDWKG